MTYFVDDHEDTMGRLYTGTATEGDQLLVYNQLHHADLYEDVYDQLTELIEPFVQRGERPNGQLPASVVHSVEFLLKFWQENKQS